MDWLVGEHRDSAGPDEHDLAWLQFEFFGAVPGDLGLEPLAVLQDQVGPDLEAEVDQPLHHGLGGGARRLIAARVSLRSVLEQVTLADLVAGTLPGAVRHLTEDPDAWISH